jgi:lipopolysaccharide export system permease protein
MKKLDWYILKKFYSTFIFIILMMLLIVLVIDYSEKVDDFTKAHKTFSEILSEYYVGFVPHIVSLLFHLFVFIAVIFFTGKMANQTEIIPILASGVSYTRFLRPFFIGGLSLAILLWWANSAFIPHSNKKQTDFKAKFVDPSQGRTRDATNYYSKYLKIDSNTYAGIKNYDTTAKTATQFFYHTLKNNRLIKNGRAQGFKWDTAKQTRNTWRLDNVVERTIIKKGEKDTFMPFQNRKLSFAPDDIKYDEYVKDKLTNAELRQFISLEKKRGSSGIQGLQVELYRRGASAFAVLVLTMMGVLIASRKNRGGIGIQLALGIVLAISYVLMDKFTTVFATNGSLSPMLAAWLPNIIYTFVTVILYLKAQK